MRRTVLLLPLLAATLVPMAAPAEAVGFTCLGKKATLVGNATDKYRLEGTKKNDVIVTNGSVSVNGKDGDDLICVTKAPSNVYDGAGDDKILIQFVITDPRQGYQMTSLVSGHNTYVGSSGGREEVALSGGVNDVRTRGGDDVLDLEQTAGRGHVDLGPGDDEVRLGRHAAKVVVDGGAGNDVLDFLGSSKGAHWTFDAVAGVAQVDGRTFARWHGMDRYQLRYLRDATNVRFKGTAAAESVYLRAGFGESPRKVRADLGGGADKLWIAGNYRGRVALGTGRDELTIAGGLEARVDLGEKKAEVTDLTGRRNVLRLSGVEDALTTFVTSVGLVGDTHDNVLRADGACTATISGLGGDDRLSVATNSRHAPSDCDPPVGHYWNTVDGGAGDDRLVGGALEDLLRGGSGKDRADGGGAKDECRAEKVTRC